MKKLIILLMVTVLAATTALTGCGGNSSEKDSGSKNNTELTTTKGEDQTTGTQSGGENEDVFTKFDKRDTWDSDATVVELGNGDVVIDKPGTYVLSGKLEDGQVSVNVDATEKVQLVFNGVDITCKDGAPIYIINADKVSITLAEGTTNTLKDGGNAQTSEYKGCIYAKDDLSINGSGKLVVKGTVKNGIHCNNDLAIVSGTIEVSAVDNGIKADDSLSIKSPILKVEANDAIKVSDNNDSTKGTFYMEGGELTLAAEDDGISVAISLTIKGGKAIVAALDKAVNCDGTEDIKEGCLVTK